MKKKQYLYAISFWFTDNEGRTGQSCSQIIKDTKIDNLAAFNSVVAYLKETNNFSTVAICNIMLLGKVKN
jgi:hypothetical protein